MNIHLTSLIYFVLDHFERSNQGHSYVKGPMHENGAR